jgi:hypothetical protein
MLRRFARCIGAIFGGWIAQPNANLVVMNDARFISAYRTKLQSKLPS